MITYTFAESVNDLTGILALQAKNLARSLCENEIETQGFVTVEHSFDLIKKLNDTERHIIAKEKNRVIGYVLSMTKKARFDIPVLYSMFEVFDQTLFKGSFISEGNFIIVGQVCVDKEFRGQGIFEQCYRRFREYHKNKYDFAITEIATTNLRSLHAHKRIGFSELTSYTDQYNTTWIVVVWDWANSG